VVTGLSRCFTGVVVSCSCCGAESGPDFRVVKAPCTENANGIVMLMRDFQASSPTRALASSSPGA
jgi:hypothetical protein